MAGTSEGLAAWMKSGRGEGAPPDMGLQPQGSEAVLATDTSVVLSLDVRLGSDFPLSEKPVRLDRLTWPIKCQLNGRAPNFSRIG